MCSGRFGWIIIRNLVRNVLHVNEVDNKLIVHISSFNELIMVSLGYIGIFGKDGGSSRCIFDNVIFVFEGNIQLFESTISNVSSLGSGANIKLFHIFILC
jgi:hypothetical protein